MPCFNLEHRSVDSGKSALTHIDFDWDKSQGDFLLTIQVDEDERQG